MSPLLQIDKLTVDFRSGDTALRALDGISFSVNRNEIVAVVGESGSGKSVTALSILRLLPASARLQGGRILFAPDQRSPVDLVTCSAPELLETRGNQIGMIFQEPMTSLNPVFTCGHQIVESLRRHRKLDRHHAKKEALSWLKEVQLPDPEALWHRYPHQLSGGQKQRVMIAMAMCCHPSLLICDEPTTALDVTIQKTILGLIRDLQQREHMGVIFITHDLGVVADLADRVVVMYRGAIVEENTVPEIFEAPGHPYTRGLLACRQGILSRGQRLPVMQDFLEAPATLSRNPVAARVHSVEHPVSAGSVLTVRDLHVWFPARRSIFGKIAGYTKAVNGVSFDVRQGETLGLVGESGCGKTTLGRTLMGLVPATSGSIIFRGEELTVLHGRDVKEYRRHMQIIFQDPFSSLNPRRTIGAAIAEPLLVHGLEKNAKARKERVISLLERVGMSAAHYSRYPHEFSGGQRQRIGIARALALQPSFLVCDESVSALDVSVQAQVLNLLQDLRAEFAFSIIFISHDLSVVRYLSDRVMVMNQGSIEETGTAEDVWQRPQSAFTRQLMAAIPGKNIPG